MSPPIPSIPPFSLLTRRIASQARPAAAARPKHILLVADAKLPPPVGGNRSWARRLNDAYVHKAWAATQRLRPDAVVFLGDMLALGSAVRSDS